MRAPGEIHACGGHRLEAGVDEAGRGPLAGPVEAAAVVLDPLRPIAGLRDSKQLTACSRERLAVQIRSQALAWAIGWSDAGEIDALNILQASLLAMRRALQGLAIAPRHVRVDGNRCPPAAMLGFSCGFEAVVGGDATVSEISAASILAKVSRDHWMTAAAACYPDYGFERHKGYPTAEHLRPQEGFPLLLDGGAVACPGVAAGPAVYLDPDGDLEAFPEGGVLVAKRSSPKFVRLMARAKAIVTDAGSTTGHMASLARELRVPALLNTRSATRAIPPGTPVTVDAGNGYVYEGEVAPLLARQMQIEEGLAEGVGHRLTPELKFLETALTLVSPLNLTDPQDSSFVPERCRTLHDLARFIHPCHRGDWEWRCAHLMDGRARRKWRAGSLECLLPLVDQRRLELDQ